MDYDSWSEFVRIASYAYNEMGGYGPKVGMTFKDAAWVFCVYFSKYFETFGVEHPHISKAQIKRIMWKIPYIFEADVGGPADIDTEDYRQLIDKHFKTDYRDCDYNINHFFSGRIRQLRWYECFG